MTMNRLFLGFVELKVSKIADIELSLTIIWKFVKSTLTKIVLNYNYSPVVEKCA